MPGLRPVFRLPILVLLPSFWAATVVAQTSADDRLPDRGMEATLRVEQVTDPELLELVSKVDLGGPAAIPIQGRLAQVHRAATPPGSGLSAIEEWFVSRSDGSTIVVAVPIVDAATPLSRQGTRVLGRGIEVGMLAAKGRDGALRSWPLYLGRFDPASATPWGGGAAAIVGATVLAAGGWFLLRRRLARSSARSAIPRRHEADGVSGDESTPNLPPDPADAMAILADLAEEGNSTPADASTSERSDR